MLVVSLQADSTRAVANSVSGQAMPVGDIPGWEQVFADDFTTDVPLGRFPSAVAHRWGNSYPDGWSDTSGNGRYFPSKVVSIANGMMNLRLHTENGVHMVAAPVPTIPGAVGSRGGQLYGRYAVRFRAASLPGYKTAWLLWPDSGRWPQDGEVNFPEGNLDRIIKAYLHPQGATTKSHAYAFATSATYTSWHTAVIEWSPGRIDFILDGALVGRATEGIPNTPMHWVLQTETVTSGGEPADSTSGNVQIDWVAVYKPSGRAVLLGPPRAPVGPTAAVAKRAAGQAAASLVASRIDRLRARGRTVVSFDAPAAGSMIVKLTTRRGTRAVVLGRTHTRFPRGGKKRITIRLTRAARVLLARRTTGLRAYLAVVYTSGAVRGMASRAIVFTAPPRAPVGPTAAVAKRAAGQAAASLVASRIGRLRARGRTVVSFDAPAAGSMIVKLTARRGTRAVVLGRTHTRFPRGGKKRITIRLTRAARVLLARRTTGLRAYLAVVYTSGAVRGMASRAIVFTAPPQSNP